MLCSQEITSQPQNSHEITKDSLSKILWWSEQISQISISSKTQSITIDELKRLGSFAASIVSELMSASMFLCSPNLPGPPKTDDFSSNIHINNNNNISSNNQSADINTNHTSPHQILSLSASTPVLPTAAPRENHLSLSTPIMSTEESSESPFSSLSNVNNVNSTNQSTPKSRLLSRGKDLSVIIPPTPSYTNNTTMFSPSFSPTAYSPTSNSCSPMPSPIYTSDTPQKISNSSSNGNGTETHIINGGDNLTSQGEIQRSCSWCGTTKTPEWRRGPNGPKTLCNACGLKCSKRAKQENPLPSPKPRTSPKATPPGCSVLGPFPNLNSLAPVSPSSGNFSTCNFVVSSPTNFESFKTKKRSSYSAGRTDVIEILPPQQQQQPQQYPRIVTTQPGEKMMINQYQNIYPPSAAVVVTSQGSPGMMMPTILERDDPFEISALTNMDLSDFDRMLDKILY